MERDSGIKLFPLPMINTNMNNVSCQYCLNLFTPKLGSYGKFCSLSCGTSFKNIVTKEKAIEKYNARPNKCKCCKNTIDYEKRANRYCSRSCAAKITNQVARKRGPSKLEKTPYCKVKFILCPHTNQYYSNKNSDGSVRRCSPYTKDEKQKYYSAARFKFNVYHYPEEFDLALIQQHGWYTCPGLKRKRYSKNVLGVSRDHIISVSFGFKNKIDPKIISHPANCRIILHSDNKRKHAHCGFTIDQLLEKIKDWDKKYTERRIGLEPTTSCLEGKYSTN